MGLRTSQLSDKSTLIKLSRKLAMEQMWTPIIPNTNPSLYCNAIHLQLDGVADELCITHFRAASFSPERVNGRQALSVISRYSSGGNERRSTLFNCNIHV